jgi:hypothetical protein
MEKLAFTKASLSNVRATMTIMSVSIVEWSCQVVM